MPLRQTSSEAIVWAARRDSHFLETMRGIKTIKLCNGQRDRRTRWLNLLVETVNRQFVTQRLNLLFKTVNALLLGSLSILVVYLAARMILANVFSVGMRIAFIAYKDLFVRRVSGPIDTFVELRMPGLHAERLADIALTAPQPQAAPRAVPDIQAPVGIEARNLSFRYGPNDPLVLDSLSFRIEPAEWVAFARPSGCGKTTLLKLLAGLLQPTSGTILVNGEPMTRLGAENWRAMIGVVMQDDSLFAGSLADKIAPSSRRAPTLTASSTARAAPRSMTTSSRCR